MSNHHCIDIESLPEHAVDLILNRAQAIIDGHTKTGTYPNTIKGKVVYNLFFEDSTRTRMSFETATLRGGGQVVTMAMKQSSMNKGESFTDTLLTLSAMKPDAIVMRHTEYNAPLFAAQIMSCPIINAGDSWRAHPTQALLDLLTMRQVVKGDMRGLTVAICGDIAHSRVARSNYITLSRAGVNLRLVAPEMLMPKPKEFTKAERFTNFEKGIQGVDFIMMLRIQKERLNEGGLHLTDRDYAVEYGLTGERLDRLAPNAYVMHPGPMNRNLEISDDAADDPRRSLVLKQVANGVPVRLAVLEYCFGLLD